MAVGLYNINDAAKKLDAVETAHAQYFTTNILLYNATKSCETTSTFPLEEFFLKILKCNIVNENNKTIMCQIIPSLFHSYHLDLIAKSTKSLIYKKILKLL